jgi:hypothetical protein
MGAKFSPEAGGESYVPSQKQEVEMQENNIRISLIQDIRGGFRVECSAEGSCIEDTRKFLFEALLSTLAKADEMGLKLVPVDEPEKPPAKSKSRGGRT